MLKVGKDATYKTIGDQSSATVFIYNHTSFYADADRIVLPNSLHTNIIMKKQISEIAESPYSECVIKDNVKLAVTASTDTELIDLFIKSQYKYNYANCFDVCYQSLLKENCGCIDYYVPFLNLKKIDIQTIKFCNYNDDAFDKCFTKFVESLNVI